ncbi:MAG TPA: PAS domain-containing protein [Rhizomicrobium sp.]
MNQNLLETITAPSLKAVAAHWFSARGDKKMPSWDDLKPKAIARQLPLVWSLNYDPATKGFTGRLAGDRIARLIGKSFRGLPLEQAQTPAAFGVMRPLLSRVVTEPAIYFGSGNIFQHENAFLAGERLLLPLAANGENSDGLLGATEYQPGENLAMGMQPAVDLGFWFDLDGRSKDMMT